MGSLKIKELTNNLIGQEISCIIRGESIKSAKIQKERNKFYICQNLKNGDGCSDKFDYCYSWGVLSGSETDLHNNGVTDIKLLYYIHQTTDNYLILN